MLITGMSKITDGRYMSYVIEDRYNKYLIILKYDKTGLASRQAVLLYDDKNLKKKIRMARKWQMYAESVIKQEEEEKIAAKQKENRRKWGRKEPPKLEDSEDEPEEEGNESFGEESDPEYEKRKTGKYKKLRVKSRKEIKAKCELMNDNLHFAKGMQSIRNEGELIMYAAWYNPEKKLADAEVANNGDAVEPQA
jgi:hypothetical protein